MTMMKINLKEILDRYLQHFPDEKKRLTDLAQLVNGCWDSAEKIFDRKNFRGHITASGFVYCKKAEKLLLLEHKALKMFLQPGGHVEPEDKDLVSAAEREIAEETGLQNLELLKIDENKNVPFDIDSHKIPRNEKKGEEEHYHHDFRYLFIIKDISEVKLDANESNGYKWVSVSELEGNNKFASIIKKMERLAGSLRTITPSF